MNQKEGINNKPKLQFKNTFPIIFYDKNIMSHFWPFLNEESIKTLKSCLKKTGAKEQKKKIKELVKNYIIDFGKHSEKVKYGINENGILLLSTSIFNIRKEFLPQFTHIRYKNEDLELEENELYEFLKVFPKNEIYLSNNKSIARISKPIIGYDNYDKSKNNNNEDNEEDENEKRYQMFYNEENINDLKNMDFSNKELMIERQKKILEKMNEKNKEHFFPLQFISKVNYWSIILCEGGYFAFGFFLKDQLIEHKSDHKYVVRKKAGLRQVIKDKSKNIKSIGAQMRRANEKKHQENIELILKLNEDNLIKSDCIFISAPGFNKGILIGENKPLSSYKKKILNIPYNISKANYTNLMMVFKRITSTYFEIDDDNVKNLFK
jgi:hypothetical protein